MGDESYGEWQAMDAAPRDGAQVLLRVRASEQGPSEVDVARWVQSDSSGEGSWIAADSDPTCVISYAEAELLGWMPLPDPLPELRSGPPAGRERRTGDPVKDELGGSGI